jgi:hypothetical protein
MTDKLSSSRVSEVAYRHRLSRSHVYNEIKAGRLKARKSGDATIVTAEDEADWLASMPLVGADEPKDAA